jgi:hypothetical protein
MGLLFGEPPLLEEHGGQLIQLTPQARTIVLPMDAIQPSQQTPVLGHLFGLPAPSGDPLPQTATLLRDAGRERAHAMSLVLQELAQTVFLQAKASVLL